MKQAPTIRIETIKSWRQLLHEGIYDLFMKGWSLPDLCELFSLKTQVIEGHLRNVMQTKENLL